MMIGYHEDENSHSEDKINLDVLFEQQGFNVAKLLAVPTIAEQAKRQNDQMTDKLIKHQEILKQLFDICFKPSQYSHPEIQKLNKDLTYRAIEILNNLSEQFCQFIFNAESEDKKANNQEDVVITDDTMNQQAIKQPNPVWLYCLSVLKQDGQIQETPLSYLMKIITSLCYQKPKQILEFFLSSGYSSYLFKHFYSRSVFQFIFRLLEIQDSLSFYEPQKILLLHECQNQIKNQQNTELLLEKLENYEALMDNLLEKVDDRFDRTKYSSLARDILGEKKSVEFILTKYHEQKNLEKNELGQLIEPILKNIQQYLSFATPNRNISQPQTQQGYHNKLFDNNDTSVEQQIKLNNQAIDLIKQFAIQIRSSFIKIAQSNKKKIFIINYLKLIKSLINIVEKQDLRKIMSEQFINLMLSMGEKYNKNNVMQNLIKDIVIQCVNKDYVFMVSFLLDYQKCCFGNLVTRITSGNSKNSFQNQLYHIFQKILKKGQENSQQLDKISCKFESFENITSLIQEKQKFYSFMAGGNARKQSSCWGDSSSQIVFDRFLPISDKRYDQDKNIDSIKDPSMVIEGNQEHWFDCGGLPLDSDQSREQISSGLSVGKLQLNSPVSAAKETVENIQVVDMFLGQNSRNQQQEGQQQEQQQMLNFSQHFSTYLSYQIDDILSDLE